MSAKPLFKPSAISAAIDIDIDIDIDVPESASNSHATALIATTALDNCNPTVTGTVILLETGRIRVSSTPNRDPSAFENEEFEDLRRSICARGQNIQPICVRSLPDTQDPLFDYELLWGERRLRACQQSGLPVRAIVAPANSVSEDFLDRIRENRFRADLSPYEFSQQVQHALAEPPGMKKIHLAAKLGCSVSTISRSSDMAALPLEVVEAFSLPADIRYEDVKPLRDACKRNLTGVLEEACRIKAESEPLAAQAVVKRLVRASKGEFAACKLPPEAGKPQSLEAGGQTVGSWRTSAKGGFEVQIEASMSDMQREAFLHHVLTFVARKVLKQPSPSTEPSQASAPGQAGPSA